MLKQIVGGVVGGLVGFTASHFYATFKRVKAELYPEPEKKEEFTPIDSGIIASGVVHDNSINIKNVPKPIKDLEETIKVALENQVDPAICDISEVEAAALNAEEVEADRIAALELRQPMITALGAAEVIDMINDNTEEELEYLRHDANSPEAWTQYRAMRLAEINEGPVMASLLRMFEIPFQPGSTADETVGSHIYEARCEFFGEGSIYTKGPGIENGSFAELVLHYADLMSVDFGEPIDFYADELVGQLEIHPDMPQEELQRISWELMTHQLHTRFGFGLFALREGNQGFGTHNFTEQYNGNRYFEEENEF
jgi:hypothetical protein